MSKTRTYKSWTSMKNRCTNPNKDNYDLYGGRGITVCIRWMESFEAFLYDMGERPPNTTLDRINCNRHYEPSNCRWASIDEQANNRGNNHRIRFQGETHTVVEWARKLNIPIKTLYRRLEIGWSYERALTEPLRKYVRKKGRNTRYESKNGESDAT